MADPREVVLGHLRHGRRHRAAAVEATGPDAVDRRRESVTGPAENRHTRP
ncbi:hypothetical protein [Streptomyces phaeochromogenes]|uniref:Uncharacterized protein n=1 Tax=Streptomyces phaeochromogenes TaxID=1923 RepID=A0ABZ1HI14_STRPH|nr:hypothetical protein [Streptomyces phaeochromogenes]WSD17709.1 hypothetical protein OHB35_33285 [Streptomyces phaeochromogenes]WSJ05486.1 hypothetical protein OG437_18355 [Streptomyces phaeochromogenes]